MSHHCRTAIVAGITTLLAGVAIPSGPAAGIDPDSPCYMRDGTGRVIDMGSLCNPKTAKPTTTVPTPSLSQPAIAPRSPKPNTTLIAGSKEAQCQKMISVTHTGDGLYKQGQALSMEQSQVYMGKIATMLERLEFQDQTLQAYKPEMVSYFQELSQAFQTYLAGSKQDKERDMKLGMSVMAAVSKRWEMITSLDKYCKISSGRAK